MLNVVLMAAAVALAPPSPAPVASPAPVLWLYLARHGQTAWNAERRLQGGKDIPLNDTGRQQARDLAARLEAVPLDRIYTSALSRSRQTGDALEGRAPREALPGLNEQSIGAFEGVYADGREAERYAEFQRRSANPDDALDGGESKSQFFARVRSAVEEIRRRHPAGGQVLIVAHGGTNMQVLRALLDLSEADTSTVQQANDELYLVELREGRRPLLWKLIPPDRLKEL